MTYLIYVMPLPLSSPVIIITVPKISIVAIDGVVCRLIRRLLPCPSHGGSEWPETQCVVMFIHAQCSKTVSPVRFTGPAPLRRRMDRDKLVLDVPRNIRAARIGIRKKMSLRKILCNLI